MQKQQKFLLTMLVVIVLVFWFVGLMGFTNKVFSYLDADQEVKLENATYGDVEQRTGIAVLTGGRKRIAEGLKLLDSGVGQRMLISGVSKGVTLEDISRLEKVRLYDDMPVDLGYSARTTVGNAKEIKTWAEKNDYKRIVAVTSFYHIPRSRLELKHFMPHMEIRFVAVSSGYVQQRWSKHWGSFCFLAAEYCKYLAVKLKYLFR